MKSFIRMGVLILLFTGIAFASAAAPVRAAQGGPSGGYYYVDSQTLGGPAYNFEDISTSGTVVPLGDATLSPGIPLGFSPTFTFFGTAYTQVYICANGYLTFVPGPAPAGTCPYPSSSLIPNQAQPQNLIAGWWADLDPAANLTNAATHAPNGTVTYQTLGVAPNRRFIVQFTNILHFNYNDPNFPYITTGINPATFQFKLFEGSNFIEVHYQAAPASTWGNGTFMNHSAGIENSNGTLGLNYNFNTSSLATPVAVRYYYHDVTPPVTTLLTMPANPTNQTTAIFTFTATDAGSGVASYQCKLDGAAFAACTSPAIYNGLSNGSHTFSVFAVDYVGNPANPGIANPASYTWTIDTLAPNMPVLLSPPNGMNQDLADPLTLTFQWQNGPGPGAAPLGYELKINNDPPIDVGNMTSLNNVALNKGIKYTWSVRAYADALKTHVSAYAPSWWFTIGTPVYLPIIRR